MKAASGPRSLPATRRGRSLALLLAHWTVVLCCTLAMTRSAAAHPTLDTALERAAEADFDAALQTFAVALSSGELDEREVELLFSERALVLYALDESQLLDRDLSVLAMLSPYRDLGRAAPPALVARWEQIRSRQGEPLAVSVACKPSATGTRVEAAVKGLTAPALARVTLHTRTADGSWVQKQSASADFSSATRGIEYYADVQGPNGVVLRRAGTAEAPFRCVQAQDEPPVLAAGSKSEESTRSKRLWWWIGGAGAAAAAAAVAVVFLVQARSDDPSQQTTLSKPTVTFE